MVLGNHNYLVHYKASEIAKQLGDALVAPVLAYVPDGDVDPASGHIRWPGTITTPEDVFMQVLEYAARSLRELGFVDVVFLGDSGGNQSRQQQVADALNVERGHPPDRVHHISAYYPGEAMSSSSLLYLDPSMLRVDQFRLGRSGDGQGHTGDPNSTSALFGRQILEMQIEDAVAQIQELRVSSRR